MATSGKGTAIVGNNVQMAAQAEHHLIVAHEVTNVGNYNVATTVRVTSHCASVQTNSAR
ncbi:hypothetical protein [Microvirga aerophila]|uniref:Uncharacterized protein n=1 Tax=Microvirga aerophila TaxID=670291 RepID=A0A512C2S7_9HYPH|nr:hypothetical protein [Microvirga aerophila]GEO18516.1 hypothetical protein MAE02_62120 [Microvirga aerophila]